MTLEIGYRVLSRGMLPDGTWLLNLGVETSLGVFVVAQAHYQGERADMPRLGSLIHVPIPNGTWDAEGEDNDGTIGETNPLPLSGVQETRNVGEGTDVLRVQGSVRKGGVETPSLVDAER